MKNDRELISSGLLILLGLTVIGGAARYSFGRLGNPGPGFFPVILGTLLVILSGASFFRVFVRCFVKKEGLKQSPFFLGPSNARKVIIIFGCLLFFRFAFQYLGLVPGLFFFSFLAIISLEPARWRKALIFSICSAIGNYLLFSVWLQIEFPVGILGL